MDQIIPQFISLLGPGRVSADEEMSKHSSFHSGGRAVIFLQVDSLSELQSTIQICRENKIIYKVIGSGTLAIFSDHGFNGVVIKNNTKRFEVMTMLGKIRQQHINVDKVLLYAEAGANINQVVRYTIEEGLSGLEYQLGLPGTVGGAIYSNAQFPPKQKYIGEALKSAKILTSEGEIVEVDATYFDFGFDSSSLQNNKDVLLSVVFELAPESKNVLWERGMQASSARSADQPSEVGYTYRNMHVTATKENLIIQPEISDIIQQAELGSLHLGDVKLSEKRYNYLINTGEAKTSDFIEFISKLKGQIQMKTGAEVHVESHII